MNPTVPLTAAGRDRLQRVPVEPRDGDRVDHRSGQLTVRRQRAVGGADSGNARRPSRRSGRAPAGHDVAEELVQPDVLSGVDHRLDVPVAELPPVRPPQAHGLRPADDDAGLDGVDRRAVRHGDVDPEVERRARRQVGLRWNRGSSNDPRIACISLNGLTGQPYARPPPAGRGQDRHHERDSQHARLRLRMMLRPDRCPCAQDGKRNGSGTTTRRDASAGTRG